MTSTARTDHPGPGVGHRIIRGMIVIIFFGLFMRLGAFLINWLINHIYGPGPVLDSFTSVYNKIIFLLLFSSALKIINPAFMPLFAERRQKEGEEKAWELASTVTNLSLIAGAVAAAAGFLFAPQVVGVLLPKFTAETQALATVLLRWMLPGLLIQMLAVQALGILNSYKVFSYPAAADAFQKLVWTAGLVTGLFVLKLPRTPEMAAHLIGAAYLVSCGVQGAVLLVGLRDRLRFFRLAFPALPGRRLAHEALWVAGGVGLFAIWLRALDALMRAAGQDPARADRDLLVMAGAIGIGCLYAATLWYRSRGRTGIIGRFAFLAAPLIVGVLFARFRDMGLSFFQTYTPEGQYGMIDLARKVANFPSMLIAFSLSVAMFPYLCDMAVRQDEEQYTRIMTSSLRMIALVLLPLTAVTIVLAGPVMQMIFDKGKWSPQDIHLHGMALAILSMGIFFYAIENVLMQAFFSQQRTVLPTVAGIVFAVLPILALWVLIERMGLGAWAFVFVCVAEPTSRALKNLCLLFFVSRQRALMSGRELAGFAGRLALICAALMATAWGTLLLLARVAPLDRFKGKGFLVVKIGQGLHVGVPAAAVLIVFLLLCLLLRMEEAGLVVRWVRERGWKLRGARLPADKAAVEP